ncbi:hypothetical protein [Rhizobium sp. PAMB 3182]
MTVPELETATQTGLIAIGILTVTLSAWAIGADNPIKPELQTATSAAAGIPSVPARKMAPAVKVLSLSPSPIESRPSDLTRAEQDVRRIGPRFLQDPTTAIDFQHHRNVPVIELAGA